MILKNLALLLMCSAVLVNPVWADSQDTGEAIEQAISLVKPDLKSQKISAYAKAILKAARKYKIDPLTLTAITHQESSFRENLPLGKAGEIGLLQIRRLWIQNPRFRKAFRNPTEQDLANPEKAFAFAAWILSDLKRSTRSNKLPYWTFYNARKFENRLRYFVRVKRHLTAFETKQKQLKALALAKVPTPSSNVQRILSETTPVQAKTINQPREILNQINWHLKALELFNERES